MNVIVFDGRLTKDAEFRTTQSGKSLLTFTVANEVGFKDNKTTNFFRCELWGKKAEALESYLVKGKPVTISAEAKTNNWTDNDGNKQSMLKFNVQNVSFHMSDSTGNDQPRTQQKEPRANTYKPDVEDAEIEYDDDIPF